MGCNEETQHNEERDLAFALKLGRGGSIGDRVVASLSFQQFLDLLEVRVADALLLEV